jgi:hypothetical protein
VSATQTLESAEIQAEVIGCGLSAASVVNVQAKPLPPERRESRVTLLARLSDVPGGSRVILSDVIPANAKYVPGSGRLLVAPTFDVVVANPTEPCCPIQSGDRLFWLLPADIKLVQGLRYKLAHEGTLEMPKDRVGVILVSNGRPAATVGSSEENRPSLSKTNPFGLAGNELRLLEGDASVLTALQGLGAQAVARVVGGPVSIINIQLEGSNDLIDRGVIVIEAFDQSGLYANDAFVTLESSAEPLMPDAAPEIPGYQAKLENGLARIPVRLGSTEANIQQADVSIVASIGTVTGYGQYAVETDSNSSGDQPNSLELPVPAAERPLVAAGVLKLEADFGLGATPTFSLEGSFKAFARGNVLGDALLTIATNETAFYTPNKPQIWSFEGSLLPANDALERFPVTGDASTRGSEPRSSDGFYIRLERGLNYGTYGQITPGFTGILSAYSPNFNGFQGELRDSGFGINAFAAMVPNADQRFQARGDGTTQYILPNGPLRSTSERVVILTFERDNPSLERSRRILLAQSDYTLDYESGVLTLAKALNSTDPNGNP